ncbi:MAG: ATP-grasp domain-containing protein [Okeania sp. SIO3I5]|uniref:ATP-grasp domain-containing protein n=1 Tax=Okeania sp. SIO3I5 TaxID=2607805 RepID=UPI0013B98D35|nr:ATP-grasp domain-containing protein [Okeania sp. SIO3I5]NEQ36721.1 ATP-grasp domain-containing protein [Okeania sp. SIO3I5]
MAKLSKNINVLCVGAGIEQLPVIKIAQKMGLNVTALDGNPTAVGLEAADRGIAMDIRDAAKVVQLAKEADVRCVLPVPLGAILTTVGAVNDALGLRGISEEAAQICTDKLLTRQILAKAGLPTPEIAEGSDRNSLLKAAEQIGWPVVVKPRYGSGSQGVFVARDKAEFESWIPWHLEQRQKCKESTKSLVESFVSGHEIGVDSAIVEEMHSTLLIRDKEVTELPFRLPYGYLTPSLLSQELHNKINTIMEIACKAIGLENCLVHADIIINSDKLVIIEISGRPSGFNISAKMLPAAIGISALEQTIIMNLGGKANFQILQNQGAVLRMLSSPIGSFVKLEGLKKVSQMPGVVAVESFLKSGDIVEKRRTSSTGYSVGYLLTTGKTRSEAEQLWNNAASQLKFNVD